MDKLIELGHVAGFFGVKGWVKLYSHTRPRGGIAVYRTFHIGADEKEAKNRTVQFTAIKEQGKNIVGHISGVDTREKAESYLRQTLFVKQSDLPALDNEYYWHQLIGLRVVNADGKVLGNIVEMMETGANDVMVIHSEHSEDEVLIPYVMSHFVLNVDLDKGEMQVDWELDDSDGHEA